MAVDNRYGVARTILIGLVITLIAGVAGSMWLSVGARRSAEAAAVEQARSIASESLGLVLSPSDFGDPVSDARAIAITQDVSAVVLEPSDYTTVTVWDEQGVILYSTDIPRIGNLLAGERERIRSAIRGEAVTQESDGDFSVMVPLSFEGVGPTLAVELIRPSSDIGAAAGPWRTIALFLLLPLAAACIALYGVGRMQSALGAATTFRRLEPARPLPQPQIRAPQQQPEPVRRLEAVAPGLREEADARRMAEERAHSAEERLALLQEQYKKALDDLQTFQRMAREAAGRPDPRLEERALRAEGLVRTLEGQVHALQDEREKLASRLDDATTSFERADPEHERRISDAEQEAVGLRAELEGAHAQLSITKRELKALQDQAARSSRLQEDLDGATLELRHTRDALLAAQKDLDNARSEVDDARTETRALRGEEQRATELEDELRTIKAELASATASHRAELVEREADLEVKVRAAREQFQQELGEIESSYRDQLAQKEAEFAERISSIESESSTVGDELAAAHAELQKEREVKAAQTEQLASVTEDAQRLAIELQAMRSELSSRAENATAYLAELDGARTDLAALRGELVATQESLAGTQAELLAAQSGSTDAGERAARLEKENGALSDRIERMGLELEAAAAGNADLNRKLQEIEARRALELADDSGRAEIDELLRVTQERLAGQTEKLMAAEDRIHELEHEMAGRTTRLDEVESQLRQHQMSDALREIREPVREDEAAHVPDGTPIEDRRASTPFMKELAVDAKRNLTRIMGITQVLKHKKEAKDYDQLVKQLSTLARRLDHALGDLAEADELARGTIELTLKRTNVEALVERVVEESGVGDDHDVRVDAKSFSITVDPQRTEQIVSALLRNSGERTAGGKSITVRLSKEDGGALIIVEDPEPSSDASMSPLVQRFAEAHGGWARVESRDGGGSAFKVFLPDAAPRPEASKEDAPILVADTTEAWEPSAAQILVQELHRLAEKD